MRLFRSVTFIVACVAIAQSLPGDRALSADAPAGMLAFLERGKILAASCSDGKIRLWDAHSGALRQTLGSGTLGSPSAFLTGNNQLATVERDGSVQIWDAKTMTGVKSVPAILPRATRLAVSEDGSRIATAHMVDRQSGVNTVRVRDGSGKDLFSVPAGIGGISLLAFSPDGSTLVAGSYDADVRVWSVRNGELVKLVETLPVAMFAASFSPDGTMMAAAGVDRTVYLWDAKSWKLLRTMAGQPEMISAIEFSPDGRKLVTGGFSELTNQHPVKLIVWDVQSARQLRTMTAPRRVVAATFSPDGKQIASSYGDRSVNVWQVPD